jgi:5S rRNA maturation endonuclease (ribonuclease M5)
LRQGDLKQQILGYFGEDFTSFYQRYLGECRRITNGDHEALCPFHDDTKPSFQFKAQTGEWYCHAEKKGGHIFEFYALKHGLSLNGQFPQILEGIVKDFKIPIDAKKTKRGKRVAHYDYTDENGNVVHRKIKYEPKSFKQCAFVDGKWVWSLKGVKICLYNLPEVLKQPQIWICEGEKDADTVNNLGFENVAATTNPMGAKEWKSHYNQWLKDKDCVLFPDNDREGIEHMKRVGTLLVGTAKTVKVVSLPDLPLKGDFTDYVEKFESKEKAVENIKSLIEKTDLFKANTLEEKMREMNDKHAVIMVGGDCCVLNEIRDPIDWRPTFSLSRRSDLKNFYSNNKILISQEDSDKAKEKSIADVWFEHPERRTYSGIVFNPSQQDVPGYYNTFRGLAVEPKKGRWNYLQDHIYEVWAKNNVELAEYIFKWMAYKLQHLGERRCDVALALRGERGAGKGIGVQLYGNLFFPHFVHVSNQAHVTGRFNSILKDALFVYLDEAFWAGDKQAEGILKALITENIIVIELKGKDVFRVKKHADFILASNNSWVVPAGLKERRFCVLDVSSKKIGDKVWFERIIEQMNNGGKEAMLYALLKEWDVSNFDPRDFPRTEALADQIIASMDSVQKFWFTALQDGEITIRNDTFSRCYEFGEWVVTKDLHKAYETFCKGIKERHPVISKVLIKNLKKLCPDMRHSKRTVEGKGRKEGYTFPDLARCRELLDEAIGFGLRWDDNEQF